MTTEESRSEAAVTGCDEVATGIRDGHEAVSTIATAATGIPPPAISFTRAVSCSAAKKTRDTDERRRCSAARDRRSGG